MDFTKLLGITFFLLFFGGRVPNTFAQIVPRMPAADTIYIYRVVNNDTNKRILSKRLFHLYDKQGYIREILLEKRKNNTWEYESRMIFAYNAINRLQIIKYEVWDSVGRDWLKYKRRVYAYNIRYLPIEYTDELWNDADKSYQKFAKTIFLYNKKHQVHQAVFKVFRQGKWTDSLRKTLIYDTLGNLVAMEQRKNLKDTWISQFYWEYKYEKKLIKEIILKDAKDTKNLETISKSVFFYNAAQVYVGKQEQEFVAYKKPFKEKSGTKAWYNPKKKHWIYSFYQKENDKTLLREQWVLYPTSEAVQISLPNFPFSLDLEW